MRAFRIVRDGPERTLLAEGLETSWGGVVMMWVPQVFGEDPHDIDIFDSMGDLERHVRDVWVPDARIVDAGRDHDLAI